MLWVLGAVLYFIVGFIYAVAQERKEPIRDVEDRLVDLFFWPFLGPMEFLCWASENVEFGLNLAIRNAASGVDRLLYYWRDKKRSS